MSTLAQMALPKAIDPLKLVDHESEMTGEMTVTDMPRLTELGDQGDVKVSVSLRFGRDNTGNRLITGCIDGSVMLICQRCGQPMTHTFSIVPHLSPVMTDEQAKSLPKDYDPLVTRGESVNLAQLVEEEVLLNLPMVPKHAIDECAVALAPTVNH